MSKKLPPFERPVTFKNVVPMLQSRIVQRAKFIHQAEEALRTQRATIKAIRQAAKNAADEIPVHMQEMFNKTVASIRLDIKSLAIDQKLDRVQLRQIADYERRVNSLADLLL